MSKKIKETFNPVKEDRDDGIVSRIVWSTNILESAIQGLAAGKKLKANPFYENNVKLIKGDLVYQRTDEEIKEWIKCKNDILYFSEKYCQLMTPEGIKHVQLRDYQEKYLTHLTEHQLSIYLACRQCGKCNSLMMKVLVKISGKDNQIDRKLKKYFDKFYYIKDKDCYELPLFELYNLYDNSFSWKIKYQLYKLIKPNSSKNLFLYKLISFLDKSNRSPKKIIKSHMVENIEILTPEGWRDLMYIHQTRPYERYIVETDNDCIECADDHIMYSQGEPKFAKDFVVGDFIDTICGPKIVKNIKVDYNRVSMCDVSVNNESKTYYSNNFISHNTTTSAIYLLHFVCFNTDKTALCTGNKRRTAVEILDKIKKIFFELPYFLKPGIYKWNEAELAFDNGCRVLAEATTLNTGIGFSINLLLLDEFAHLPSNIMDKFYNNIFPTIVASKSQLMITSTQNGYNLFYRLYSAAEAGENDYSPFKTDWWEVPEWNPKKKCWEKRDEAWHQRQVANYGSEEAFNAQFGTNFDVSAATLISQKTLTKKRNDLKQFISKDLPGVPYVEKFLWDPDYEPMEQLKKDHIIITCDIAEGIGKDYTVFMINRMINVGTNDTECVGLFRSNSHNRDECALALQLLCVYYLNPDNFLLSLEYNTYGELFLNCIYNNIDKNKEIGDKFDISNLVKYYNESGTRYINGVKITSGNKTPHCLLFKEGYERGNVINNCAQFMFELDKFCDDGTNHFKASYGHDDMVMAQVQLEFVKKTLQYKIMRGNFDEGIIPQDNMYNPFESQVVLNSIDVMDDYYKRLSKYDVN